MSMLPTSAEIIDSSTTNAQQKGYFERTWDFLLELLGADSTDKAGARAALGAAEIDALDINTTGGTSTAYTLTPSQPITAYAAGQSFFVNFNAASGASPTLTISGIGTPPNLVKQNPDGSFTNIAANEIPSGHRSRVTLISATQALVERVLSGGTWTPTDASGASLGITASGSYTKIGNVIHAFASVTYPANANGSAASLSGFPVNFIASDYGRQVTLNYINNGTGHFYLLPTASSNTITMQKLNGAAITNADLSNGTMFFTAIYPAS